MKLIAATVLALAAAASAAAQQPESGTFTLVQNGATIATESFERGAGLLVTELTVVNQATLRTRGTLRPDATLGRLDVTVYGPGGATGEPVQTSAVLFGNGTASFEQPVGTPAGEPREIPDGAVPYLNPSPTFMEQILRRARVIGGDSVAVPVWTPAPGGGRTTTASVVFGKGAAGEAAATLTLGGVAIEVATDRVGRLLSARVPSQALEIRRD